MEGVVSWDSPEFKELVKKYSPYLAEVRKRVFMTLAVFAFGTIGGFLFYENIIKFLIDALSLNGINIVFTSPFQFINLAIACGATSGLIFTFPLIIYQFLSFLRPALKRKEFKTVIGLLPFSAILFLIGFSFGAFVMKWQIQIFLERAHALGIGNALDISHLLATVLLTSALMGVGFQFPIILLLLLRIGIVKHHQLSKQRLWVYLGSFIFAILLPPDSILADILLSLPLIIMFEVTLILNKVHERKKIGKTSLEGV